MKTTLLAVVLTFGLLTTTSLHAEQTHMDRALEALQKAKYELQQAERDKGGHRTEAVKAVDRAIEQVNLGIEAGAHH